jgi:hypothetical protein
MKDTVGIGKEEPDAPFSQKVINPLDVTALRKPKPSWTALKMPLIVLYRDQDLSPNGLWVNHQQGEIAVGCPRGNNLKFTQILEILEGRNQVPPPTLRKEGMATPETLQIHLCNILKGRFVPCPLNLPFSKLHKTFEMDQIPLL